VRVWHSVTQTRSDRRAVEAAMVVRVVDKVRNWLR
jgi:hypothetical protein